MSVSLGTLMLHGDKQKIGHEKNLTMIWIAGRATHRFIATIGGARGMEVTTGGSGRHVNARTVVVIRELMKISSNNGLEKMMQTPVKATQRLMTKMSGRRPLEDIAGKSGGKKRHEADWWQQAQKRHGEDWWPERSGADWWQQKRDQWQGQVGVSVPGTQLVDRAVLLATRHKIRHCFNGKRK